MITKLGVENFKAIEVANLNFGKINVLVGTNSVGKSTVIQSILSISQYLTEQYPSRAFTFVGTAQDLGPIKSVLNKNLKSDFFKVNLETNLNGPSQNIQYEFELSNSDSDELQLSKITSDLQDVIEDNSRVKVVQKFETANGQTLMRYLLIFPDKTQLDLGYSTIGDSSLSKRSIARLRGLNDEYFGPNWFVNVLPEILNRLPHSMEPNTFDPTDDVLPRRFRLRAEAQIMYLKAMEQVKASRNAISASYDNLPRPYLDLLKGKPKTEELALQALTAFLKGQELDREGISRSDTDLEGEFKPIEPIGLADLVKDNATDFLFKQLRSMSVSEARRLFQKTNANELLSVLVQHVYALVGLIYVVATSDRVSQNSHFSGMFEVSKNPTKDLIGPPIQSIILAQRNVSGLTSYLGPLRTVHPSEQRNGRSGSALIPLGKSGEYMAHYLHKNSRAKGKYPLPDGSTKATTLEEALNSWANYFDLGSETRTKSSDWGATDFTLDGERTNQKGTGISQIVPVLIMGLSARKGDLVIIEQPELHLHPSHQRKLADFFVAIANSDVQLILETHSEYLVTRLRLLVALKEIEPEYLNIIFAENQEVKKENRVRLTLKQTSINQFGKISYWPSGFLEDTLEDKMLLSSIQIIGSEQGD